MKILAFESSCDETAIAILEDGVKVISEKLFSQIDIHSKYGGVIPEIASRNHLMKFLPLLKELIEPINLDILDYIKKEIDAIAVTQYPGLVGSLLIGVMLAKTIALIANKPLIAINHLEAHVYANFIANNQNETPKYPFICLVVSGGHTDIVLFENQKERQIIGRTRDDAAGECFDKVARYLDLPYPGGPNIDKLAQKGDPEKVKLPVVNLENSFDFSFSGLKTAITMYKKDEHNQYKRIGKNAIKISYQLYDLIASFQEAVVNQLLEKTIKAANHFQINNILLAGGVSANSRLRQKFTDYAQKNNLKLYYPSLKYCTDNASMIGALAYQKFLNKDFASFDIIPVSRVKDSYT